MARDLRRLALWIVLLVTAARLLLLAFNRADLFVDESQYWLWGQSFAFGYYSKPPLVGWVIGLSTWIGGDTAYFVRAPFALFHGATALVLAALADRLYGPRIALLTAATYVTLPMAAVGSLLASTDSVMGPFFVGALYFWHRAADEGRARFALLGGFCLGFAFLAKYAALYFLIGAGIGAALLPALRIGWRNAALFLAAFGLIAAPNLIWNALHGFSTVSHTVDNVSWVRETSPLAGISPTSLLEFVASQFAVAGPLVCAALLYAFSRAEALRFTVFALPPLLIVSAQALIDKAYANWAATAFFAGTIAAVHVLSRRPALMAASLAVNGALSLLLPLLTLVPTVSLGGPPLLKRYVGEASMSAQIIGIATRNGSLPIVSDRRDILADLFFTGVGSSLRFYALPPKGRPMNHYEQAHPLPPGVAGKVLFVSSVAPVTPCKVEPLPLDAGQGVYATALLQAFILDAECLRAK